MSIIISLYYDYRVNNQISATTYIDKCISGMERAMITILTPSGSSSQMLIHSKPKATVLNHVGARDENVTQSDNSSYQMFVPNFR